VPGYRAKVGPRGGAALGRLRLELPAAHPAALHVDELGDALAPLRARMAALEEENRALKGRLGGG
jgi:hypothetical protein